jgi:hypothetical protein
MARRVLIVLLAVVAGGLSFGAHAAIAQGVGITATCDPNCHDWRTSPFEVSWNVTPAPAATGVGGTKRIACNDHQPVNTDTKGLQLSCIVDLVDATGLRIGGGSQDRVVRLDGTPPLVTDAAADRAPDGNGWYRAPVEVEFQGDDVTSGIADCTSPTYSGPEGASARVIGTCTDNAGNRSAPFGFPLRYDTTGPDITGARPGRKPDHGRWYTRPVLWQFRAADTLSGLDGCEPLRYSGPDGLDARATAFCRDRAGNESTRTFTFAYDATPPARPAVVAATGDRRVRLLVTTASDTKSIVVRRRPGRRGRKSWLLYRGAPKHVTDRHVRNGRQYRYTVTARDAAGNWSRRGITLRPGPQLLAPAPEAVVTAPPLLDWTPVRRARYYNVQLRRNGRKVLSAWPARSELQLGPQWRYRGRERTLEPGTYRWEVWPGLGSRRAARYGRRIGRGTFTVPAPVIPAR